MSDEDTLNVRGLDQLVKALKTEPKARIGILGGKVARPPAQGKTAGPTNAEIGAYHEFGTAELPQRSFLRIPLTDYLNRKLAASGALDKDVLAKVIAEGSLVPWLRKVGIIAESVVLGAFETGGYGKWKPSDMRRKENWQTLVETQQLKDSITSEVKEA